MDIEQPLELTESFDKYDFSIRVNGGGLSGQAGAVRLGIARALLEFSEDYRKLLRQGGMLIPRPGPGSAGRALQPVGGLSQPAWSVWPRWAGD